VRQATRLPDATLSRNRLACSRSHTALSSPPARGARPGERLGPSAADAYSRAREHGFGETAGPQRAKPARTGELGQHLRRGGFETLRSALARHVGARQTA
jgi:hypothetical protein